MEKLQISETLYYLLSLGYQLKIASFAAGVTTSLTFATPHCRKSGDKILLFASHGESDERHEIADGQLLTVTVISPTVLQIPLDTSLCAPTEGLILIPENINLSTFYAKVEPLAYQTQSGTIIADGSNYIFLEILPHDDCCEQQKPVFPIDVGEFILVDGLMNRSLEVLAIADWETFKKPKHEFTYRRKMLVSGQVRAGITHLWKVTKARMAPNIGVQPNFETSTLTLIADPVPGVWAFKIYQSIVGSTRLVIAGDWTIESDYRS